MQSILSALQIMSFPILILMAGYVLNRARFHPLAIVSATALFSYALIQLDQFLGYEFRGEMAGLGRVLWFVYPLPVAMWAWTAILLKPGDDLDLRLDRVWWTLLLPVTVLLILGGWVGDDLVDFASREPESLYRLYALYNVVVTAATLVVLHWNYRATSPNDALRSTFFWLRLAGLAYVGGMLILLAGILSPAWVFALLISDIMIWGIASIIYDAVSEGQSVLRDFGAAALKSILLIAFLLTPWLVLGMADDVWSIAYALGIFFVLGFVPLIVTLQEDLERLLDKVFFREEQPTREALRTLMVNTTRRPTSSESILSRDYDEFVRLTRRALSHMPNLPRLAASPLTDMAVINQRLDENANALQRANELRQVLAECIDALRPQDRGEFGISDEWRFYNALYSYVAGISPYKRSLLTEKFDKPTTEVIRWFQVEVPPRTLYNWQNRGAELIADILLEQEKSLVQ